MLLDDYPLKEIPDLLIANSLAYVDQEIFLFEGSVRDNLTLWDVSVDEVAITQALKDAEIHADIGDL